MKAKRNQPPAGKAIDRYDATDLIGLPVVVIGAALEIREDDDTDGPSIAIPSLEEFGAAAALARCQMPQRLRGFDVTAQDRGPHAARTVRRHRR
jgi:hypothetical protein